MGCSAILHITTSHKAQSKADTNRIFHRLFSTDSQRSADLHIGLGLGSTNFFNIIFCMELSGIESSS